MLKKKIPYKQALRDASPSYKTRNEIKPEVVVPIVEPTRKVSQKEEPTKFKRKSNKKVVENITLKL